MFHQVTRLKWPENISDRRLRGILPCDLFAVNFFNCKHLLKFLKRNIRTLLVIKVKIICIFLPTDLKCEISLGTEN